MAKIYVSSTYSDLQDHRAAASKALRRLDHDVGAMEDYVASDQRPLEKCLADVADCDLYVGIFAWRYGYVPPQDNAEESSITEREYRKASQDGKPCLIFLLDPKAAWSPTFMDSHTGEGDGGKRIRELREELGQEKLVSFFQTPDELGGLVGAAVTRAIAESAPVAGPKAAPRPPPAALEKLHEAVRAGGKPPDFSPEEITEIVQYSPRTLDEYRLARMAEWSQSRFQLDKRFVELTLLVDQGEEAQGPRWQASRKFEDLADVLNEVPEPALVVLGPPGSGKSTLLRHFEMDLAGAALREETANQSPTLTFFIPLNLYKPTHLGGPLPPPKQWLEERWRTRFPHLPELGELLEPGGFVLLIDALNEMPHAADADYRERIGLWRDFVAELARGQPRNRIIFSCRSLDYSAPLSTRDLPVPQVRIEALSDAQVERFLELRGEHGEAIWENLAGSTQLDLYRSPYLLSLLADQADAEGNLVLGRAALFTGLVRQALKREVNGDLPLFQPGALLNRGDYDRVIQGQWNDAFELPSRSPLFARLTTLAYRMQEGGGTRAGSQVRVDYEQAVKILDHERAEDIVRAGVALQVLDANYDDVAFVHQLLQEYFAARALAADSRAELLQMPWRADEVSPTLEATLAQLADSDPLPPAAVTGWEETAVLAAAMAENPENFVGEIAEVNLPVAGRCAAPPDVDVSDELKDRVRQALIRRTEDPDADLRARIAAGRALGELGDSRFERRRGPHGEWLLPPLIAIERGTYTIGSDEGLYDDEAPVHEVKLTSFAIGQFPVTNAEWRLFLEAGSYDDERWWETEAAKAWRRGEGTAEGPKQDLREWRQERQANFEEIREWHRAGRITSQEADEWEEYAQMSDDEFEALLEGWYPPGRQTQPAFWHDEAFNDPAQPVVGICWYEARAYCAWLSAQTGQPFRLPTEAESESAARGTAARRYAYGDDFDPSCSNTFETHVRATTPVGVFPGGETPEGLIDMTGNVFEWTSSIYEPYPYRPEDGRENPESPDGRRAVRGGSWEQFSRRCARLLPPQVQS